MSSILKYKKKDIIFRIIYVYCRLSVSKPGGEDKLILQTIEIVKLPN